MAEKLGTAVLELVTDSKQFNAELDLSESRMKELGSKTFAEIGGKFKDWGRSITDVGKSLSVGVTVPITAMAVAAFGAGQQIDDALDTIRISTGATGERLGGLESSFKNVFKQVPDDAQAVAAAIGDIHARTGATGPALETLAVQLLRLARMGNEEVGPMAAATTRLFGDWSIASDQQSGALDNLFKVSQASGLGFTKLNELLVQFGAPLRQFGFSIEESAALLGKWEKEGVNTELVLGSLRIAMGNFAEAGVPMRQGLEDTIAQIQTLGPGAEATSLAMETFGARAGPDMAAAILEGRFAIDELMKTIGESPETIATAAGATEGFSEKWQTVKNNLILALEPLGTRLLAVLEDLTPMLLAVAEKVAGVAEWFGQLSPTIQTVILAVGGIVAAIGPALAVIGTMASGIGSLLTIMGGTTAIGTAVTAAFTLLTGPIGIVVAAIAGLTFVWVKWGDDIKRVVSETYTAVKTWLVDKFAAIVDGIKAKIDAVAGFFRDLKDKVVGNSYVPEMVDLIGEHIDRLDEEMVTPADEATATAAGFFNRLVGEVDEAFGTRLTGILDSAKQIMGAWRDTTSGLSRLMAGDWLGAFDLIAGAFKVFKSVGTEIAGFFRRLFGGPNAQELAGREIVANFERNLSTMLNESQRLEAGNASWKMTVIAIRDAYLAAGLSEQDALRDAERLWQSSKEGGEDATAVVEDITRKMQGYGAAITGAFNAIPSTVRVGVELETPDLPAYAMARGGSGVVTRPTLFLAGEAGPEAFNFTPLGGRGGDRGVIHTHVFLKGREIATAVEDVLMGDLRLQKRLNRV